MTTTATERVGRYQLLEPIGHGPSGTVSRAKVFGVAGFERQFAIKRFHAELTSGQQAQSLSTAARAYGGLEHPRIARMSEFGIAQGTTFTAVEFVAGLDAFRLVTEVRLGNGTLAAGGALALVSQAARAVGYAHGRGLTHLGLSPTNVVITPEGDVKITDFGILAATMPARPIEIARLAHRICYLAPEQLTNEATSAATDVFALGVLAYELVTGQRAFRGDTPAQIAKAVVGGPPGEPTLPRPIVRVLQRCLARSPFERFPDARALADALDAALRVAPVPGTRKDIGSQVKLIIERLADLNSGELSGMLSLGVGTANLAGPVAEVFALGASRDSRGEVELETMEFVRPDTPVAGPTPLVGPAGRQTLDALIDDAPPIRPVAPPPVRAMSDIVKVPPHTVPGLAPPPIPRLSASPPPIPALPTPGTLLGVGNTSKRPLVGAVPPPKFGQGPTRAVAQAEGPAERPSESPVSPLKMMSGAPSGSALAVPISRVTPAPPRLDGKKQIFGALRPDNDQPDSARTDLVIETDPGEVFEVQARMPRQEPAELPPSGSLSVEMQILSPDEVEAILASEPEPVRRPISGLADGPADRPTNEMSPLLVEQLNQQATRPSAEMPQYRPSSADDLETEQRPRLTSEMEVSIESRASSDALSSPLPGQPPDRKTLAGFTPSRSLAAQRQPPMSVSFSQQAERNLETMDVRALVDKRSKTPWIIAAILGVMALSAGVYVAIDIFSGSESTTVASKPADAAMATAADAKSAAADAMVSESDAIVVAAIDAPAKPVDATPAAVDAAPVAADAGTVVANGGTADTLSITSTPVGARVYLDGADSGLTPLKLPGSPDKHNVSLLLAGHVLYTASIDGHGNFTIPLPEVSPPGGPAGIKVLKCKDKDRYYVFVDGKPTGMMCPTERIECDVGPHTVETYDAVTETRHQYPVVVKDTRLSVRVRVEP